MGEEEIVSFVSYLEKTLTFDIVYDVVLYRGQPVRGNLRPGVCRANPKIDSTEQEKTVLKQLRLQGASMLPNVGDLDLELLVLAQHSALKTRLLDWTSNPLAALWFACSDRAKGDVYVYVLAADDLLEDKIYDQDPFLGGSTQAFQPRLNNPRIIAQQGWFTLHRFSSPAEQFIAMETDKKIVQLLHGYRIPEHHREEMLTSLDRFGISARTLFPDVSGLCQYLNWRHYY